MATKKKTTKKATKKKGAKKKTSSAKKKGTKKTRSKSSKKGKFLFTFLIDTSEATGICQLQPGASSQYEGVTFDVQKEALGEGDVVRLYAALGEMRPVKTPEDALVQALNYAFALEATYSDILRLAQVGVEVGKTTLYTDNIDDLRGGGQMEVRAANGLRMPNKKSVDYATLEGPSPGKLPKKGAEMLRQTFRGAVEQFHGREGMSLDKAEELAARTAWTQVKRYYYKQGGKWKKRKHPLEQDEYAPGSHPASYYERKGNKHVPSSDEYGHNLGVLNAYADEAIYLSDPRMAQHVAYQAHVALEPADRREIVGKLQREFPGTSFSKRELNQGAATEVLEAKRIVDAANEYSAALRDEFQALERGTPREVEAAQQRAKAARRQLRALTGARRQLYGAMFFGTGGAALGAAIGGVPGAAIGAMAGATAGQLLLRPRGIKEEAATGPRASSYDDGRGGAFSGPRGAPRPGRGTGMRPRMANGIRHFNPTKPTYQIYVVSCDGVELVGDETGLEVAQYEELDMAVGYATAAQYDADVAGNPDNERYDVVAVYPLAGEERIAFSTRADGYSDKGRRMRERNGERKKDECAITGYVFDSNKDAREAFDIMHREMLRCGCSADVLVYAHDGVQWIPMIIGIGEQDYAQMIAESTKEVGATPKETIFVLADPKGKEVKAIDKVLGQSFGPVSSEGPVHLRASNGRKKKRKKRSKKR